MRSMFSKLVMPAVAFLGLFVLSGCASSSEADRTDALAGGMYCPKCETVWVTKPVSQGTKVATLQSERKMTCPTCDATAASQLKGDGTTMLHECPECKGTPVMVKPGGHKLNAPAGTH